MPTKPTAVLTKWEYILILLPTISKYASIHKADVNIQNFNIISQQIPLHTNTGSEVKKRLHPVA